MMNAGDRDPRKIVVIYYSMIATDLEANQLKINVATGLREKYGKSYIFDISKQNLISARQISLLANFSLYT